MANSSQLGLLRLGAGRLGAAGSGRIAQAITGVAGIPSAETFGAGGSISLGNLPANIVGHFGIPGAEAFGAGGSLSLSISGVAGIPSAQAFGAGGSLAFQINGRAGIPSVEAIGRTGALLTARPFTLFVGGVDRTDYLKVDTMSIVQALSSRSTAQFTIYSDVGVPAFRPQVGQEIYYYAGTVRKFGGTIDETDETNWIGTVAFDVQVRCVDFAGILDHRVIGKYYTVGQGGIPSITIADIVQRYLAADGITYEFTGDPPGVNLGAQTFNWLTATDILNQIVTAKSDWEWNVDFFKVLRILPKATGLGPAPFSLADDDGKWRAMTVRNTRTNYRNRQGVRSSQLLAGLWTDVFHGDTHTQGFITTYIPDSTPIVTVNAIPKTVLALGEQVGRTDWDFYWIPNGYGVFQNPAQTPYGPGDLILVSYPNPLPPIVWVQNDAQIAARAAIEHTSGVYENVVDARDVTDIAGATQFGLGLLARYGDGGIPKEVKFETDEPGLQPGQILAISTTRPPVSGSFLVQSVNTKEMSKQYLRHQVMCVNGAVQNQFGQLYERLILQTKQGIPRTVEIAVFSAAPDVPGVSNPGFTASGVYHLQPYVVRSRGAVRDVSIYFADTSDKPVSLNVYLDNVLMRGSGEPWSYGPYLVNPVAVHFANFTVNPLNTFPGQIMRVEVGIDPAATTPAKHGVIVVTMDT